jgi:peptidoglycan-associated lipoprotein
MKKVIAMMPLVLFACSSTDSAKPPQAAAPAPVAQPAVEAKAEPASKACTADTDCGNAQICVKSMCTNISDALAECTQLRVHFSLDSSEIPDSEQPSLERLARCLNGDRALKVTIEGNADERGTAEYNISLGQRRSLAVEKYLQRLGASDERIKAISYGKEKPVCNEHNESCWAENRRAAVNPR